MIPKEPKEKAKELVDKFLPHSNFWDCYNDEPLEENHAVKCALIAVDEILKPFEYEQNNKFYSIHPNLYQLKYWQEVKEEIELL